MRLGAAWVGETVEELAFHAGESDSALIGLALLCSRDLALGDTPGKGLYQVWEELRENSE